MPSSLIYLGVMLAVIIVWFVLVKRPVYEAVFLSFLLLLTITGTWGNVLTYIDDALSTSLLYSMVAFVSMSIFSLLDVFLPKTSVKVFEMLTASCADL